MVGLAGTASIVADCGLARASRFACSALSQFSSESVNEIDGKLTVNE
jgi:hypothetical protein